MKAVKMLMSVGMLAVLLTAYPALPVQGRSEIDREIGAAFAPMLESRVLAASGAELVLEEAILASDSERRMAYVPVLFTPALRDGLESFAAGRRTQVVVGGFYVSPTSRWDAPPPGVYLLRLEGSSDGAEMSFIDARGGVALTVPAEIERMRTQVEGLETMFGFLNRAAAPGDDTRPERCWKAEVSFLGFKISVESHPASDAVAR